MTAMRPTSTIPEPPGDAAPVTIRVEQRDGVVVVRLVGEIDLTGIHVVERALEGSVQPDALGLVVDLTGVSYFSSATIKLLFSCSERLMQRGQRMRVAISDAAPMRKVLSLVNFDSLIPLDQTIEEAQTRIIADARR